MKFNLTKNKFYRMCKKAYRNKIDFLIADDKCKYRGTGKSYSIVKMALKYNIPIYTSMHQTQKYLQDLAHNEFKKDISVIHVGDGWEKTIDFNTIILVDGIKLSKLKDNMCYIGTYIDDVERW